MSTIKQRTRRTVWAAALLTALATLGFGPVTGASAAVTPTANSRIAYVVPDTSSYPRNKTAIFTMRPDGTDVRRVTAPSPVRHTQPNWSPDGTKFAFQASDSTSTTGDQFQNIFTINTDGSNLTQITHATSGETEGSWPTWSPDGTRIAYSKGGKNIFISNADGSGGETQLTNFPCCVTFAQQPQWSPDGNKMLFFTNVQGSGHSVYPGVDTIDINGTNVTQLVPPGDPSTSYLPEFANWSPSGSQIAYTELVPIPGNRVQGHEPQLFIMNADGSGKTQLTHSFPTNINSGAQVLGPGRSSWSPDEQSLAFERRGPLGAPEISIIKIRTLAITTPLALAAQSDGISQPDWSPFLP